jgi:hypothetical protein
MLMLGALSAVGLGQGPILLDEKCIATVGNQTALVDTAGVFLVQNVSIFQSRDTGVAPQLYRVRATCNRDGVTTTGQSDFFSLNPGRTTFIADVFPSELSPIPVRISVNAPAQFIPLGQSVQLDVTAHFVGGGMEDRTLRSMGTTYLSTNTRLLTVSQDGLVTGANSTTFPQMGTIAVLNEGNLATIMFTAVGTSNDFDNDGMPNDFEDLYGLNKFFNDTNFDLDADGLTNVQEYTRGTIPNNPDTDADGILDGVDGDPLHPEESPPMVMIASPTDGDTLIEGQTIVFSVNATDDGQLASVVLSTDTGFSQTFGGPPFQANFVVPVGVTQIVFSASATDSVPNMSSTMATVSVIPDPLTTVIGTVVLDDGTPVDGASLVTNGNRMGTSIADGSFLISDVQTALGGIVVMAEASVGGAFFTGSSAATSPVLAGITDVGEITLTSQPEAILVFGDRFERFTLEADLVAMGHTVTNVQTLPLDLSTFGTIWHVGAFVPITAAERTRLSEFVSLGRGLHLTGERPCCEGLNDSIELYLNSLVVGGGVAVGGLGDIVGPYPFNPNAVGGVTTSPNLLIQWIPNGPGGLGGLGMLPDGNILASGSGGRAVGGVWRCTELVGGRGKVTLFMDVNWFSSPGRLLVIANIQNFLGSANVCGP